MRPFIRLNQTAKLRIEVARDHLDDVLRQTLVRYWMLGEFHPAYPPDTHLTDFERQVYQRSPRPILEWDSAFRDYAAGSFDAEAAAYLNQVKAERDLSRHLAISAEKLIS